MKWIASYTLLAMCTAALPAADLYTYTLEDGRKIVGKIHESANGKDLYIKMWMKDRFVGKLPVTMSEITGTEPWQAAGAKTTLKSGEDASEKDVEIFYITLRDDRVLTGVPKKIAGGQMKVKTWFKGRFMGTITVPESDVVSVEKVPSEEVPTEEPEYLEDVLAEEELVAEKQDEIIARYENDAREQMDELEREIRIANSVSIDHRQIHDTTSRYYYSTRWHSPDRKMSSLITSLESNERREKDLKRDDRWRVRTNTSGNVRSNHTDYSYSAKLVRKERERLKDDADDLQEEIGEQMQLYKSAIYKLRKYLKACERFEREPAEDMQTAFEQYETHYERVDKVYREFKRAF